MAIEFSETKKLNEIVMFFFPKNDLDKMEVNRQNAEIVTLNVFRVLDAVVKSENLYRRRNILLPEGKSFFPANVIEMIENISVFFNRFETRVFSFTKTEHQTFVFILENIVDYLRNSELMTDNSEKDRLFIDYRFWFDNFFRICDQKFSGSLYSSKNINLKIFFNINENFKNEIIFSNPSMSFSLSPFVISKGSQRFFLNGVTDDGLVYKDFETLKEFKIKNREMDNRTFEFLFANCEFNLADLIMRNSRLDDGPLSKFFDIIHRGFDFHRQKLFTDSNNLLKDIPLETVNLPQIYLLQIKNLIYLNRLLEVKKIVQKFLLYYPYYPDGFELMGDIYLKEENYELALSFHERALKLIQNKRIAEKVKKIKEQVGKNKTIQAPQKNDYYYDLSESVFQGEEEIIFRDKEKLEMIEILISGSRNNILLVGDSGVGKSAIIRALAQRIMGGDVPESLREKHVKEVNFISLLTGSKYRGQFEEKVLKFFQEFKNENSILVLEDIHLMMSSGAARGTSLDLVNILKPFLRDNVFQVIATTNYEDYKNNIEKDGSLLTFFQKINVNEMSAVQSDQILSNLSKRVFLKENIIYDEKLLGDIVAAAKLNIKEKKLPESAIVIFDRCLAKLKLKLFMGLVDRYEVTHMELLEVLSDILNLPESNVSISLKNRLINLMPVLKEDIVGQDEALERIASNVVTSKMEFDIKKNRPDGVFLFIGPTGVGKTESAIALARALYGSEDYLIRIDMSEYMEKFTYSRFIGAAPGYVGYYDSNQLTDKVRQNPFSVILLDEIEKADSQLLNIFLQVFDAGRLTDARGNVVDFSHATIIMTSNIGTSLFSRSQMGYHGELDAAKVSRSSLIKALKKNFSPEFLNRIDEIVVFKHLEGADVRKIIDIQLRGIRSQLEKQNKELIVREEVFDYIIRNGYSREYGARNISRSLRSLLLEKIAAQALEKEWDDARSIVCSLEKEEVEIQLEGSKQTAFSDQTLLAQAEIK